MKNGVFRRDMFFTVTKEAAAPLDDRTNTDEHENKNNNFFKWTALHVQLLLNMQAGQKGSAARRSGSSVAQAYF
ncbi:hypothetical protein D3C72_1948670 [compost metagenome]